MVHPGQIQGQWPNVRVVCDTPVDVDSPPPVIDGILLSAGDLVLLVAQVDARENGIHLYNGALLDRPDIPENLRRLAWAPVGSTAWVMEGDVHGNSRWLLDSVSPADVDGYGYRGGRLGSASMTYRKLHPDSGRLHVQSVASTDWTIAHNLGYRPSVEVRTDGGVVRQVAVHHLSDFTLTISFLLPSTGTARLI